MIANQFSNTAPIPLKIRFSAAGVLFFNRYTGMNVLVDEMSPSSNMWSAAPRQVSIALTNACDLNCPHCYAPKYSAILDFEHLTNWLAELDTNGCIGVGFGGGEPTLYPRLAELCSYTANKTGMAVTMTTHAHHLNEQLLNELAGNLHFVRVSMDGVGDTYESIRGRFFDILVRHIAMLSDIAPFGINFVVNSKTIGDLNTAISLAADLGAAEFLLLPEQPVGRAKGIDDDTFYALQDWVNKYHGKVPLTVSEGHTDGLPTCNPFSAETGLTGFAHIDALGVLKRTSYAPNGIQITKTGVIAALDELRKTE